MLVIGAKGFAKEVLEVLYEYDDVEDLVFYDDVNKDTHLLFKRFKILHSLDEASNYFKTGNKEFTVGIGNPVLREKLSKIFKDLGGEYTSTISLKANIANFDVHIASGANILAGAHIANGVRIGQGCLIYYNAIITHDVRLGDFVQVSPGATLLGRCEIGSNSQIGANATILPDIHIGVNVIIGAGAVVTKNIPDYSTVYGVPAKNEAKTNKL